MKTGREALQSIPLSCVIQLSNAEISEIFGVTKSTCSNIVSDKFQKPGDIEMTIKCNGAWMKSKERKYTKQMF